jgi:hypothetical protein
MAGGQSREAGILPRQGPLLSGYMRGAAPGHPRCDVGIFVVCKFGSCHVSTIFIPYGVYPLTSSAALRAEFPDHSQVGKGSAGTAACTTSSSAAARSSGAARDIDIFEAKTVPPAPNRYRQAG